MDLKVLHSACSRQADIFLIVVVLCDCISRVSTIEFGKYTLARGKPWMTQIRDPITVRNRVSCAALCGQEPSRQCFSFAYIESTNICILGQWISYIAGGLSNVPDGAAVYTSACCPQPGYSDFYFNEMDSGSDSVCVFLTIEHKENYDYAKKDCEGRGARLLTAKTRERLDFFWTTADTKYLWLGLNDTEQEGHYVWSDGTELTDEWLKMAEGEYKFDVDKDGEDCVHIYQDVAYFGDFYLADGDCTRVNYWACEMVAPMDKTRLKDMCPDIFPDEIGLEPQNII